MYLASSKSSQSSKYLSNFKIPTTNPPRYFMQPDCFVINTIRFSTPTFTSVIALWFITADCMWLKVSWLLCIGLRTFFSWNKTLCIIYNVHTVVYWWSDGSISKDERTVLYIRESGDIKNRSIIIWERKFGLIGQWFCYWQGKKQNNE